MIPYGRQDINEADIESVLNVLKSDYLTQGQVVPKFENEVAKLCGSKYAVATSNATAALHIACLALGLGKGDLLWTTPTTFVASANCALYCGADVDFVDIDNQTYNISVIQLEQKLIDAKRNNRLPKILVPVHMCGQSCEMERIFELSKEYGFRIIEDASHAIGGRYKGNRIGNCQFSDITIFSFHPVKIITTGEGGMALTNDSVLGRKLALYRSHGITSTTEEMLTRDPEEIWNYQQIDLGFNYRMTELQAALGVSQLSRLDYFVERRTELAKNYDAALNNLPIRLPYQHVDTNSSYHLYPIRINQSISGVSQKQMYDHLQAEGINVNLHYIPVYRQPYYECLGFKKGYCPESESYHRECLSIPLYPGLLESEQNHVINTINGLLNK